MKKRAYKCSYALSTLSIAISGVIFSASAANNLLKADGVSLSVSGTTYNTDSLGYQAVKAINGGTISANDVQASTTGNYADAVSANGNGDRIDFTGGTVATSGINSSGFSSRAGSIINIDGTKVNISGDSAAGIRAAGGTININNSVINHTGVIGSIAFGSGVALDAGGEAKITDSVINTRATGVAGISSKGETKLTLAESKVKTLGEKAYGINVFWGGQGTILKNIIETQGNNASGVNISSADSVSYPVKSHLIIEDNLINTSGDTAHGVAVTTGSSGDIVRGQINTVGKGSVGILASENSTVSIDGTSVTTTGSNHAHALSAQSGSILNADNTLLNITGENSGVVDAGNSSAINLSNVNAQSSGRNSYGLGVAEDGTISASHSVIVTEGSDSDSMRLNGGHISLDASQVMNLQGNAINFLSGTSTVSATNYSVIKGNAVSAPDASSAILLDNNASWEGNAQEINSVQITDNARWINEGRSTVGSLNLDNASLVFNSQNPDGSPNLTGTLTIHGDYVGNNGRMIFNSQLGADNSPGNKVIIEGNTRGTTSVVINNLGGKGAQTIDGIEIIHVDGLSDGEFSKYGRIVAGAFEYNLGRGEGEKSSNWYLYNTVRDEGGSEENNSGDGNTDGAAADKNDVVRVYRPESGAYIANLAAANTLFNTRLHDRLGETHYTDAVTGEQKVTSMWLRNIGGHTRFADSSGQQKTQANRYVIQLGGDVAQWSSDGSDRYHLGMMGGYANQHSNTHNALSGESAKGSVRGYSAGLYGTWLQDNANKTGAYVDTWAQYSWFDNSVQGDFLTPENYKSKGLTASVESGYTWKIGEKNDRESYYVQPKAQIIWEGVKANKIRESNGTQVRGTSDGNVQTRLGVRMFIKGHSALDDGKNRTFQPFIEANWIANTKPYGVNLDGVNVVQKGAHNIGELKLGVEGQLKPGVELWGNVAQQMGGSSYSDTGAMVGVKLSF